MTADAPFVDRVRFVVARARALAAESRDDDQGRRAWRALAAELLARGSVPDTLDHVIADALERVSLLDAAAALEESLLRSPHAVSQVAQATPRIVLGHAAAAGATLPDSEGVSRAARVDTLARFSAGDLVAGRYRIERFIARGGMGEVYAALDVELGEMVALKTIAPELADAKGVARFKRELALARKVTHPGVCRVFDVAFHAAGAPPDAQSVAFITMELLEGETLAARVMRDGAFAPREALPIVRALASALDAAHAAGVVHRDFKSQNVMLVDGGRAMVTDFGLAHAEQAGEGTASTIDPKFLGTPAYMAPEQVEGGRTSGATDVYAFGVVLFEMMTGALPFRGANAISIATKRLTEPPPSPRTLRPDLDQAWSGAILRCLARKPRDRFARCSDAVEAIEARPARMRRARGIAAAIVVAGAIAALGIARRVTHERARAAATASATGSALAGRRAVAVLELRNATRRADAQWLSTALADMMATELGAGDQLRAVPGEAIARAVRDLAVPDGPSLALDTLSRVASRVGADVVVSGEYTTLGAGAGDPLRIDLVAQDARSGETIARIAETGTSGEVFALVTRAGTRVRDTLRIAPLTPAQAQATRAAMPSTTESARLYAEALERSRAYDLEAARAALDRAVAVDPGFALAHAELAHVLQTLGYDDLAHDEAKRAFDASGALSRAEQLLIEERLHRTEHDWKKAADTMSVLVGFYPDDVDYALQLATDLTFAHDTKETVAILTRLRALPSPRSEDPRIDLRDALLGQMTGDGARQLVASQRAVAGARRRGERALLAEAQFYLGSAMQFVGRSAESIAILEEARATYDSLGDRDGVGIATNAIAQGCTNTGDLARAAQEEARALEIYRAVGDRMHEGWATKGLASILAQKGDVSGALRAFDDAIVIFQRVGDERGIDASLLDGAQVLVDEGRDAEAAPRLEQARASAARIRWTEGEAVVAWNQARVHLHRGELADALGDAEAAMASARVLSDPALEAQAEAMRAAIARERDRRDEAVAAIARALDALRQHEGDAGEIDRLTIAQAELALDEGHAADARTAAKGVADRAKTAGWRDLEAAAQLVLARASLALGELAAATDAIAQARARLSATAGAELHAKLTLAAARVDAATGKLAAAGTALQALRDDARRTRHVGTELECELALAALSDPAPARRARLAALERRARTLGFVRIARAAGEGMNE